MTTSCPNCGAPIEFRFDDSFVRVCDHCRNAVLRTDRDVSSLGKVADLAPIDSPLKLFSEGRYGSEGFLLVGMAQIHHPAGGIWQEWYAKLDGGKWGWLAEAQGRYYLTFEEPTAELPAFTDFSPGGKVELPVHGRTQTFTISEATTASYVSATGELPFRLVPQGSFRYVDLDDGEGTFATIDFGDEGDTPAVYIGNQVSLADLGIRGGEEGPSRETKISSARLACPSCNAPIELRAPGEVQRVTCASCNSLLDLQGAAATVIEKLQRKPHHAVPLGTTGTFVDGELAVIGHVRRSACLLGTWYPFDEYLLHAKEVGFRWLVCSDGNWSYVQPVATGAIEDTRGEAVYDGVTFQAYQRAQLRVDEVAGEFYWSIHQGEQTHGSDYIAPPAMLSKEETESEVNWSLSTYMTHHEVQQAFGATNVQFPPVTDAAANAPTPFRGVHKILLAALAALCVAAIAIAQVTTTRTKLDTSVIIPPGTPPAADGSGATPDSDHIAFTDQFQLVGDQNIAITLNAHVDNDWAYTAADLVNVDTGEVTSFDANLEYYHGYEDGESWSDGHPDKKQFIGPRAAGTYMLRLESQHGGGGSTMLEVKVQQGVTDWRIFAVAVLILGLVLVLVGSRITMFEKRRWENANMPHVPFSETFTVIAGAGACVIGVIILVVEVMK